ncbi:FeoA family protein [Limosilactobacillus ingluviei]
MINALITLHHFDQLEQPVSARLHSLGLTEGSKILLLQRYPFHGPVIIESNHQRIALRYRIFSILTQPPRGNFHGNRTDW